MVGGGVFYSDSGSWFAGAGTKLYLAEDLWRLTAGAGLGELNYDFSGIGTTQGDEDATIPLSVFAGGGQLELLRRIVPTLYGGVRLRYGRIRTDLRSEDEQGGIGSLIPEDQHVSDAMSVSAIFEWDSRDDTFYPSAGTLTKLGLEFHPAQYGDFEYEVYELEVNRYVPLAEGHLLALRGYGRLARGDVPYYGLGYLGAGADLRGYTIGRYQDLFLLAAQAEWRWRFAERWVAVGFAGLGEVAPDVDELSGDDLLPSLGLGLRYTIAPENKISLRFDAAAGKDDYAFYFGVGEAF
jgi:outer membrane protein assembly factor BamA